MERVRVDLGTAMEKVERMSNEDDGLREEDMKVVDVGAANEVLSVPATILMLLTILL